MAVLSFSYSCTLLAILLALISPIEAWRPRHHSPKAALAKCTLPLSNGMWSMSFFHKSPLPFRCNPTLYFRFMSPREIPSASYCTVQHLTGRRSHDSGTASLPAPAGLRVKAITLGRGIQNYTCEPGSKAPPKAIGAVATLYDASPLLSFLPPSEGDDLLAFLPSFLVSLNLDAVKVSLLPVQGHHFFDAKGTPTFNLGKTGLFKGKKSAGIAAPSDSYKGPFNQGVGAVDWLELCAVEGSKKLERTYRVETAGGKPPASCEGQPEEIQVEYATQYWFY